jgi:hypothetical protein
MKREKRKFIQPFVKQKKIEIIFQNHHPMISYEAVLKKYFPALDLSTETKGL